MKLINIKVTLILLLLSTILSTETNTHSKTNTQTDSKIFISEGFLKHRKMQAKTQSETNTDNTNELSTLASTLASSNTANTARTVNTVKTEVKQDSDLLNIAKSLSGGKDDNPEYNLGDGPIFASAWLKYFKYKEEEVTKNRKFFKNNFFYEQKKLNPQVDINAMSNDGLNDLKKNVPSDHHFYAVVFRNNINFLQSRTKQYSKTSDTLNIDQIKPVMENQSNVISSEKEEDPNGIQDFGNFSEGFCFKILTEKPNYVWIICADDEKTKDSFMKKLKKIKIKRQRDSGEVYTTPVKENETISDLLGPTSSMTKDADGNLKVGLAASQNITDGYWITLQPWTQCSLKCGGGISTFHRMCVPPKSGGAPCKGEAILTRPCNTKPCAGVFGTSEKERANNTITKKPIVKVMPFSSRPQRYTKCVVKESDLMLTQTLEEAKNGNNPSLKGESEDISNMQIPVRVVMNNRTVTVFAGEDYDSLVYTFDIKQTNYLSSSNRPTCFVLKEANKRAELCPFGMDTNDKMREEWDYDFNLFKYQCYKSRDKGNKASFADELDEELKNKVTKAKNELLQQREKDLKEHAIVEEEEKIEGDIKTTNQVALQAIQKELNLEAMIRQEEQERERREEIEFSKRIEEEKKKSDCLLKAIKERELENQYNLRAKQAEEQITSIKQAAAQQVTVRRNQLRAQIQAMRKDAKLRKSKLSEQLRSVRMEMATTMNKVYKKGDNNKCKTSLANAEDRQNYCTAAFIDDPEQIQSCKDSDEFCNICCDNEFGEFYVNDRAQCYKDVCPSKSQNGEEGKGTVDANGRWIWQNKIAQ